MQNRGNATIWTITGLVAIIAAIIGISKFSSGPSIDSSVMPSRLIVRGAISRVGSSTPALVEYADFQCPACKSIVPILDTLYEEYGDRVQFQYRHFPLRNIHKHADLAARVSEAAWKQGRFWEMYEKLYMGQDSWSKEGNAMTTFETYANEIGLEPLQFKTDINSEETKIAVEADLNEGRKLHVPGTPTFFLNGEMVKPDSIEEFRELLDDTLIKETEPSVMSTP